MFIIYNITKNDLLKIVPQNYFVKLVLKINI